MSISELAAAVDHSDRLAQIDLVLVQMGLSRRSATFQQLLQQFLSPHHGDRLEQLESDRLEPFLQRLCHYRDRQSPDILARLHRATTLAWQVHPTPNPWRSSALSAWRDRHRPLTVEALDRLIEYLCQRVREMGRSPGDLTGQLSTAIVQEGELYRRCIDDACQTAIATHPTYGEIITEVSTVAENLAAQQGLVPQRYRTCAKPCSPSP
ncbi:MAG: hypothetical protein AAF889_11180 [Cyanobacteria bacterium P01_D01_bin.73]